MDPLSVAGSIAGLVTIADAVFRGVYKYYKTASDASTEIKQLADRLRSLAGILHSLGILADALAQDSTHPTIQMTHISDAAKLLGEIQSRLDRSQTKMSGSKFGTAQQSIKWPFTKTKTKELEEKLAQQEEMISLALQADSLKNLVTLLSTSKDIQRQLEAVQVGITDLQMLTRVEVDAERRRILDYFLKVNPQPNLDTSLKLRHPGTGQWLTESLQFQQWIETAGSKMWLTGIPGAGKTVLTGAMVQKAMEKGKSSPKVGVAFFFCDYKDPKATVLSNILGAMASQLAHQSDQTFDELKKLFKLLQPCDGLPRDPDPDVLLDLLEEMFKYFDQAILVIDGLDECGDNTDEITQTLANIAEYSTNVTMALVSRDEYNIDLKLRESFTRIPVGARREDILLYAASEIDKRMKDNTLRIVNVELKDEILTKLSNEADGMFRWVTCQLDYLCGCATDADRREALRELPPTLNKTYERILRRINQGHPRVRQIVQKCFQIIGPKSDRLHIDDLRWLVSIPDTLNTICDENDIVAEAEIALRCSSFIRKSEDGGFFEFSHFTVREFLGSQKLLDDQEFAGYHVSELIHYATLTRLFLKFLQLGNFDYKSHLERDEQIKHAVERNQHFSIYPSLSVSWLYVLRFAPQDPECLELAKSLFHPQKSPSFISWAVQLVAHLISPNYFTDNDPSSLRQAISLVLHPTFRPIHLAALLDLPEICEYLLQADSQWNSVSPLGRPLECSIGRMYCLIGEAWQPSSTKPRFVDRILYAAHRPGQATELLKMAGSVMPDTPKMYAGKSLMVCATSSAIASLDFSPVSSLITIGWVVSNEEATSFKEGMTSLLQTYPGGYFHGPQRPLDRLTASLLGLINSLNKYRIFDSSSGYSMCVAAWNAAVELGCDFTQDVTLMDTRITMSLDALISKCGAAISNDDGESTQTCLGDPRISGPEIDDDGTQACGYSLLRQAMVKGSARTVKAFYDRGYDLNKRFADGIQPIHEAWYCSEDTLGLLFQAGASHLDRDVEGNSIWHIAASNFETEILSALLKLIGDEKSQGLQMQNEKGYTPLTLAIHASIQPPEDSEVSRFDREIVDATIKLMSDTCEGDDLCWRCPGSPWDLAAQSGLEVAVRCLHKSGIPLTPIQEGGSTPLHFLGEFASKDCAEFLMQLFPTSKHTRFDGLTPLESFIRRCVRAGKIPQPCVIDVLAYDTTSANLTESNCTLWESFCNFCKEDLNSEYPRLSQGQILCLVFIFPALAEKKIIEAYEELRHQCAAIPLFSALMGLRLLTPRLAEITTEVISRTKLWVSALVARETIEFVKFLVRCVSYGEGQIERDLEELVFTILSRGIDVHLRIGSSSILEEACRIFDCGERNDPGTTLTSPVYAPERCVFSEIVKRASPEQLNEEQVKYQFEYINCLAKKGYHHGASWMVDKLVTRGLDPNKCRMERDGDPILFSFLRASATPAAVSLLDLGADSALMRNISPNGWNALTFALENGDLEFIGSLFAKFADHPTLWKETATVCLKLAALERGYHGLSALHISSLLEKIDCMRFLIDNGLFPDPTLAAALGYNCLHFAAMENRTETIKYLSSVGLDVNQPAEDGSLPLHLAVRNGHTQAVDILMTLGVASSHDCFGMTPQMYAEEFGYSRIQERLETGQSSYHAATTKGTSQAERRKSKVLRRALESAIEKGDLETCQRLNRQGLSMEVAMPSCGAFCPLICAIISEREDIVSWILGNRVSVLHVACEPCGGLTVLGLSTKYAMSAKLIRQILDIYSDTAEDLDMIVRSSFEAIVNRDRATLCLIIEHIKQNLEKYSVISGDSRETVLANIINQEDSDSGDTPLHCAACDGDFDGLEIFLGAGADVDALDRNQRTPLQLVSDPRCAARLIAAGAKSGWLDPASPWMALNRAYNMLPRDVSEFLGGQARRHWAASSRNFPSSIIKPYLWPRKSSAAHSGLLCLLQQNNVDLNSLGYSQTSILHLTLCHCDRSSFLLSLPQIIDLQPFPWHTVVSQLRDIPWINEHWKLFKKRIPFKNLQYMMNLHPEQGISPLCQAAAIDDVEVVDCCLEMGAEIDFDGSSYGSALSRHFGYSPPPAYYN
ncbi:hypothetical protein F5B18DRAFT_462870 [Nemania serpens]|nr:hypothetical protein F5B18DRAFT_462870 [Nemania serpens]